MDRTTDLGAALGFVIDRIEEEAMRSGEPLTEEQRFLLKTTYLMSPTRRSSVRAIQNFPALLGVKS